MINISTLEQLKIEGTQNRPEILFNAETGQLLMKGRSILENTVKFFEPLLIWIDDYRNNPAKKTELHLDMDYFNTSSSKFILSIFEKLEELYDSGYEVEVFWYFNDEDMEDLGEDYNHIVGMPFKFVDRTAA